MPKLYTHPRAIDDEFRNLYSLIKRNGIVGADGAPGLAGLPGIAGADSTIKTWNKILVNPSFMYLHPGEDVAIGVDWTPGSHAYPLKSQAVAEVEYLNYPYFIVPESLVDAPYVLPIFKSTKPIYILRFYIHLLEIFYEGSNYDNSGWYNTFGYSVRPGGTGFSLYVTETPQQYIVGISGKPLAWTGRWNPYLLKYGPFERLPGALLFPRGMSDYRYWNNYLTVQSFPVPVNEIDPQYQEDFNADDSQVNILFANGFGPGYYCPNGMEINFDCSWASFEIFPGGPLTVQDITPVEDTTYGGGALLFSMIYKEWS